VSKIKLSADQKYVLNELLSWYSNKTSPYITVGGFAGTGKTTLLTVFRQKIKTKKGKEQVAFVSFTGKATDVLKQKLRQQKSIEKRDTVSTIHSLIYSPIEDSKGRIVDWDLKEEVKADLIIIDEASMLNSDIWRDLSSFNIPIIAVGDHGQLAPVEGSFNLLELPDLTLEKIHRQAADNPIINLSVGVRQNGHVPFGKQGKHVNKLKRFSDETRLEINSLLEGFTSDLLVLCGTNKTRVKMNKHIRSLLQKEEEPQVEDRVICLRNNQKMGIYNGMLGEIISIKSASKNWYKAEILMDSGYTYKGEIFKEQFNNEKSLNFTEDRSKSIKGDLFDFGYCLTVHKAQGSQSRDVILIEENFYRDDIDSWKRWLYTGITRAEEKLYVLG
jgi:exodeoxyribonuclease-5